MNNNKASNNLLEVKDLSITYRDKQAYIMAVKDLSFELDQGKTLALVGESGCGKSSAGLALLGLLDKNTSVTGSINFKDNNIGELSQRELEKLRGEEIAMIFQNPLSALNPVLTIERQMIESKALRAALPKDQLIEEAAALLERVGIPDAQRVLRSYPHQLSGGMRQRVFIAMALMLKPSLLVADEPTTALDATIQAQILELLADLKKDNNLSLLLITHDLNLASDYSDTVVVMYAGRVMEKGPTSLIMKEPLHPYTWGLLSSMPARGKKLRPIPGTPVSAADAVEGCSFFARCSFAIARCATEEPPPVEKEGRTIACRLSAREFQASLESLKIDNEMHDRGVEAYAK